MYAKMHPKMTKYALKYTPILSVFDRKIFTQFRQHFSQENEVPNLQRPRFDQFSEKIKNFRKKFQNMEYASKNGKI